MHKQKIENAVRDIIEELNIQRSDNLLFIVTVSVSPDNSISVSADTKEGITVEDCIKISKAFEERFDREEEDYEIEVGSPGLSNPLRVIEQYQKNIGRELKIETHDKRKIKGKLTNVENAYIEVSSEQKKKKEKQVETDILRIDFENIKLAKLVINI